MADTPEAKSNSGDQFKSCLAFWMEREFLFTSPGRSGP